MLSNGLIDADDLSKRALIGHTDGGKPDKGQVAFICAKRQCKDYLLQHVGTKLSSGWQPEALVKMHEVFSSIPSFRAAMRNLAWQRGLPQSAIRFLEILEGILVGKQYDESLRVQVNNSCAPSDFVANMVDLKKELADVHSKFMEEVELAKPPPVRSANSPGAPPTNAGQADEEEEELSYLDKAVAELFPKASQSALKPFITAAERRVQRI